MVLKDKEPSTERTPNARLMAFRILDLLEQQRSNSTVLLQQFLARAAGPADRNLITDLVLGTLRQKALLLFWITSFSRRPLEKIDRQVQIILQLGIYQLCFTGIPHHAAIYETVSVCRKIKLSSAASFVNGLLRAVQSRISSMPEPDASNLADFFSIRYSHPEWLVTRWLKRFGEAETLQLLKANNEIPPLFLRVNDLRADVESVIRHLNVDGVIARESGIAPGILEVESGAPQLSKSFVDGEFYIQDAAMDHLGRILEPVAGDRILEIAAAPGGKTFQLAIRLKKSGRMISVDSETNRMKTWSRNMQRLRIVSALPVVADARSLPFAGVFDAVVIDAPCSSIGVVRRHPEIKWWRKEEELNGFGNLQLQILSSCAKYVRSQGDLIYSVCSIEPEETTDVIRMFLEVQPEFQKIRQVLLLPHRDRTDGFFIAKLRRDGI